MAGSSFFALFDDIASLLDDVAAMSKVAAKKTSGVLGDDLALNAQQVSGVTADRELPVVWAVAKGSFLNKCILVPAALVISAFIPWAITPLLMIGGTFLCYEGFEKIWHGLTHKKHKDDSHQDRKQALADQNLDRVTYEKNKIKGAIRTDFILSAEIIAISLGTVASHPILTQALVLSLIAIAITIGVYGLVAGIVKIDDAGLYLSKSASSVFKAAGSFLLKLAPMLMKALSVFGVIAMFLVGGGILVHGVHAIYHWIEHTSAYLLPQADWILTNLFTAVFGVIAGAIAVAIVSLIKKLIPKQS